MSSTDISSVTERATAAHANGRNRSPKEEIRPAVPPPLVMPPESIKASYAHLKRLQRGLIYIWESIDKLEGFVKLNTMALYKILKKRDKILGVHSLIQDLRRWKGRLAEMVVPENVKEKLLELYRKAARGERTPGETRGIVSTVEGEHEAEAMDVEEVKTLEDLQALVQKDLMKMVRPNYTWVGCFLGACSVIMLDIIVMCYIPATNPNYDLDQVLALFPLFRISLMITVLTWFTGGAMSLMEHFGVNYRFMLEIDPKCQVNASSMFTIASVQTTLWILSMGLFLVDYKFLVFGGSNLLHTYYWIYPTLLLLTQILFLCLPNRTFRYRYRRHALGVVWMVLLSGLWLPKEITLVQNVVGDVLTSVAHPMGDLEYAACYYSYGFPFTDEPAKCSLVDGWMKPLIFGIPFYLRLRQCWARYRREKDDPKSLVHLLNVGKYISGIAVVLCASFPWPRVFGWSTATSRGVWVMAYVIATVYMFIWDICVDWGFEPRLTEFVRPGGRFMYPRWVYYVMAVMNLFGRSTWAMTLMPIEILADKQLNAALIALVVSTLEIVRRSAWAVLRLENEHLTNSSRYRAMLWVPRLTPSALIGGDNNKTRGHRTIAEAVGEVVVVHDHTDDTTDNHTSDETRHIHKDNNASTDADGGGELSHLLPKGSTYAYGNVPQGQLRKYTSTGPVLVLQAGRHLRLGHMRGGRGGIKERQGSLMRMGVSDSGDVWGEQFRRGSLRRSATDVTPGVVEKESGLCTVQYGHMSVERKNKQRKDTSRGGRAEALKSKGGDGEMDGEKDREEKQGDVTPSEEDEQRV
eukprot:GHVQ01025431.1.p1 GENE.GHVQ01025431.1~~GHVQ01025431.1.p1  ORF type:complete len:805 (-),score=114.09 GHVQ01025431.1:328-2742(-)